MLGYIRLLVLFSLVTLSAFGQEFKFSQFNIKDGLNDPFVYAINNDSRGYLCVGTGEGLGVFDGQKFQMNYAQDGLAEDFISDLYLSADRTLWIGHKEGGISSLKDGRFSIYENKIQLESVITGITEDSKGSIWVSSQSHGIIKINGGSSSAVLLPEADEKIINDIYVSLENFLYVSTDMGLELYDVSKRDLKKLTLKKTLLENYNVVKVAQWDDARLIVATSSSGVYQFNMVTGSLQKIEISEDVIIKDVLIDDEQNILVSSINFGLLKINKDYQVTFYNSDNGLASNAINQSFIDREGILWIGSYGEGLFKHDNEIFTNYFTSKEEDNGEIFDVFVDKKYKYFLYDSIVLRVGLGDFNLPDTFSLKGIRGLNTIWVNNNYEMFIGTNNDGVYKLNPNSGEVQEIIYSDDVLGRNVSDIVGVDNTIWIGTFNGVFKVDLLSNQNIKFDISSGLSHNSISCIFYDNESSRLYIGCKSSKLNYIDKDDKVQEISYFESTKVYNVYDIGSDVNGQLLIATYGDGLLIQSNDNFYALSSVNGLLSNFCYGISADANNDVWVTHNGGLSRLNLKSGKLKVYSEKESVSYRFVRGSIVMDENSVWFGTSTGALKFNASILDDNKVAPTLHIESLLIDGKEIEVVPSLELKAGNYDFKFVAKALSLKNPDEVRYKFKLEGYNQNWTEVSTDNRFSLSKVPDGEYQLKIVAYNEDMIGSSESEVYLNIVIKTPYWKKTWFWLLMVFAVLVITYLIIIYRENQYKLAQQELENQLEIRTKEVTEQKDKVMLINKDITDSINYAKRIQDAVLPDENKFKTRFPKSFVVYKPRDIVSGDFYWTNSTTDKLLIGCGDCTGHGVPGAFMSLLGQQMLKEIYSIKKIQRPDQILTELNLEIRKLMSDESADQDAYLMVDGMDIIITEFDFEKMELQWSSAIRPLVRYRNEEREYIKGSRSSIGSATSSTAFELNSEKLMVGDMLYLFSDGFPDQFGGEFKKKLKTSGMFKILDEAQKMHIDKQKDFIENKLDKWMANTEQTDDIIIIGVKI